MADSQPGLRETFDLLFTTPFASHQWESHRGRSGSSVTVFRLCSVFKQTLLTNTSSMPSSLATAVMRSVVPADANGSGSLTRTARSKATQRAASVSDRLLVSCMAKTFLDRSIFSEAPYRYFLGCLQ